MAKVAPSLAISGLYFQYILEEIHGFRIFFLDAQNARDRIQGLCRPLIVPQGLFISKKCTVKVAGNFIQRACCVCQRLLTSELLDQG